MQAVILAGGRGTRLFPLTRRTPKPLLPIVGQPLLCHLVRYLATQGIDEIFITAGYLGEAIQHAAHDLQGVARVEVVHETLARGTAGGVIDLLPRLHSPFLVVSGDAILGLDIGALLAVHRACGGSATIALTASSDRLRFGVVGVAGGLVTRFVEKPAIRDLVPDLMFNSGSYLLDREALQDFDGDQPVDFADDVFPKLLRTGHHLGAAAALSFWRDIGTPASFREAHFEALSGLWPWAAARPGSPAVVEGNVTIEGAVGFGDGVLLGAGSHIIGPSYLGAGVQLGPRSEVTRSVLLAGSRTSGRCLLQDVVVDADVCVPPGLAITGAILGHVSTP